MPAISITDLNNAKLDVDHLAAVATSTALTVADRLGNTKRTLAGLRDQYPNAEPAAATATTQAGLATTAKTAAEAARDAANAVGKVFTSTALGISGTTSGQSFSVLSTDLQDLIVYTNAAGVATELLRFKTKAFIDALGFDTTYSRSGYAVAWLDSQNNFALGVRDDGAVIFGRGGDVAQRLDFLDSSAPLPDQAKYARSGYVWGVMDSADNIAFGVNAAGDLLARGMPVSIGVSSGQVAENTAAIADQAKWITSSSSLVAFGDSLTQGAGGTPWPALLASALGRTVVNRGVGGQGAQAIAARQGSVYPFLSITSNTIPASGAVAVTARTVSPLDAQSGQSTLGTLGGIPGTLARLSDDSYTFTRTTPGTARVIETLTAFVNGPQGHDFFTNFFFVGHNGGTTDPNTVIQTITKMVGFLKPVNKRFVVLSCITGRSADRYRGTTIYNNIMSINDYCRTTWPENYLDVRAALVRSYNPALPQDVLDFGNDVTPLSLSSDDIHLNTAGYTVIANSVQQFLTDKGW